MRQPHQILAFPYKKDKNDNYLYGIFCRSGKKERWQGIAGGVEENETYLEACKREANEEAKISYNASVIELKSTCTIPVVNVTKDFIWGKEVLLIQEHSFGIDCTNEKIILSNEHSNMKWLNYDDAKKLLTWDSNKNALWELNWILSNSENITKKMTYEKSCGTIVIHDGKVLLIEQKSGFIGFPKGHMVIGETEVETAMRETKEETNLDIVIDKKLRFSLSYLQNENMTKEVVYFVASPIENIDLKIQESEINNIFWIDVDKVYDLLTFDNMKDIWKQVLEKIN